MDSVDKNKNKNLHASAHWDQSKDKNLAGSTVYRGEAGPFATSSTSALGGTAAGSHYSGGTSHLPVSTTISTSSTSSTSNITDQESSASKDARAAEKWRDARENAAIAKEASAQAVKDSGEAGKLKVEARVQGGKEVMAQAGEKIAETTETAKILAKDAKDTIVEKAKDAKDVVVEKVKDAKDAVVNKVYETKEAVNETIEQGKAKVEEANARAKAKVAEDREIEHAREKFDATHIDTTTTTTTTTDSNPVMGMSLAHEKSKPIIHDVIVSSSEMLQDARDTIRESAMNMLHQGKETAHEIPGKVSEISDKTKTTWTDLQKKAIETKEEVRQLGHDAAEKVRNSLEPAADVEHKDAQERGIDNALQKEHAASSFIERVKESVVDLIDKGKHVIMHATESSDQTDIAPTAMTSMTTKESDHTIASHDLPRVHNSTSPFVEHYQEIERPDRNTTVVKDTVVETTTTNNNKDLNQGFDNSRKVDNEERADLHKARLDAGEFKFD